MSPFQFTIVSRTSRESELVIDEPTEDEQLIHQSTVDIAIDALQRGTQLTPTQKQAVAEAVRSFGDHP